MNQTINNDTDQSHFDHHGEMGASVISHVLDQTYRSFFLRAKIVPQRQPASKLIAFFINSVSKDCYEDFRGLPVLVVCIPYMVLFSISAVALSGVLPTPLVLRVWQSGLISSMEILGIFSCTSPSWLTI